MRQITPILARTDTSAARLLAVLAFVMERHDERMVYLSYLMISRERMEIAKGVSKSKNELATRGETSGEKTEHAE